MKNLRWAVAAAIFFLGVLLVGSPATIWADADSADKSYFKSLTSLLAEGLGMRVSMENGGDGKPSYSITAADESPVFADVKASYKNRHFRSARHAVIQLEKDLNQAIYKGIRGA